MSPKTKVTV